MQESEGLGTEGLVALALILLGGVVALGFGFSRLVLLALPLAVLAFAIILGLCRGTSREA